MLIKNCVLLLLYLPSASSIQGVVYTAVEELWNFCTLYTDNFFTGTTPYHIDIDDFYFYFVYSFRLFEKLGGSEGRE